MQPVIVTPRGIPDVARVVQHHRFMSLHPTQSPRVVGRVVEPTAFKPGDALGKLEESLAKLDGIVDNHHGWEVVDIDGRCLYFYFSDYQFSVWLLG